MAEIKAKTKNNNTFRFKSFTDRINEIDLRQLALYHIGHENEELPEENETYFHQTLKKWIVLNLSEEFTSFSRKFLNVVTLPQLIHKKDEVIGALLEHLAVASNLSLQPLLELLYVLARDLREEFYSYFQRVLDRLVCLLNTQDAEQLEWTLICLAYLFKILKSYLKKNVGVIFYAILPLLDEKIYKSHVTNFAVECFSFIARDIRDHKKFLNFMLDSILHEKVESVRGCARLCFEIMRGIKGQFHTLASEFLQFLFESLVAEQFEQTEKCQLLHDIVYQTVIELFNFIHVNNISLLWQKLCLVADKTENVQKLPQLLHIFLLGVETKEARFVTDLDILVPTIIKMFERCLMKESEEEALQLLCLLVSKILMSQNLQLTQLDTTRLLKKVLTIKQRKLYAEFVLNISEHAQFELLVLPDVLAKFEENFDEAAFELLAALVLHKRPLTRTAENLKTWQAYNLQLKKQETLQKFAEKLENLNADNDILMILLMPHFSVLQQFELQNLLEIQIQNTLKLLAKNEQESVKKLIILALLIETYINLQFKLPKNLLKTCLQTLQLFLHKNVEALQILDQLLGTNGKEAIKLMGDELKLQLSPLLSSNQHETRLLTAHCLQALEKENAPYKLFFNIESIEPNVQNYREQLLMLQKLETAGEFYKSYADLTEAEVYKKDTVRFLMGLLNQNFKLTWAPVQQLLEEYAKVLGRKTFWQVYKEKLQETVEAIKLNVAADDMLEQTVFWETDILNDLLPVPKKQEITQLQLRNYRNLLWEKLSNFGQIAETENRDIVTLFLNFVNEEYKPIMEKREYKIDLNNNAIKDESDEEENDDEEEEKEEEEEEDAIEASDKKHLKKMEIVEVEEEEDEEEHEIEASANKHLKKLSKKTKLENVVEEEEEAEEEDPIEVSPKKHLKKLSKKTKLENVVEEEEQQEEESEEEEDKIESSPKKHLKKFSKKTKLDKQQSATMRSIIETLCIKLNVFVAQPNPKALHREAELYELYLELLIAPNALLQKLALDCISAYKWTYITPYKSQLYAFIDEREFRKQLVSFKLEEVAEGEREKFTQILLRILYGKMLTKGAQMAAQQRKTLILRFLAQCKSSELYWFLHMAFSRYKEFINSDLPLEAVPSLVSETFSLDNVWLPQRLNSVINLLELMRKQFGGLLQQDFQVYMLKLLIFVGQTSELVLQKTNVLNVAYKRVRNAALLSLVNFFQHINHFAWQAAHMECITEVFVWPNITRLPMESIHTPTPLMKLLMQWGEQPRLFVYLNQKQPLSDLPIFHFIIQLLLNKRAKLPVRRPIMALIERLLKDADYGGLDIVKPFIMQILERIRLNFNTKKPSLQPRDLSILSLMTAHVEDVDTCDSLLQLLMPVLILKTQMSSSAELTQQILMTLGNLVKRLEQPEVYFTKLAALFEHVQEVAGRKMLCQLLTDIAKQRHKQLGKENMLKEELREIARLIFLLNAWDQRWVEQPDYDKRLDALKEIKDKIMQGSISLRLGVLVTYNCFYFIRYDKDMGLRDNALEHLSLLMPKLIANNANNVENLKYIIEDVLFNWFKRSLRDASSQVREGSIKLLGVLSRECSFAHECFADLAPLVDAQDVEVDFFENLVHLQSHRHGRALLKFCAHAATLNKAPNVRTLMQFLMPLTTRYLLQDKYAAKHTLIDAAIETLGVICKLLPWQQYHGVLRFYLMKLRTSQEHQKQSVRIVMSILDAFHFDLRQAETNEQQLKELKNELLKQAEGEPLEEVKDEEELIKTENNLDLTTSSDNLPILQQQIKLQANAAKRVMSVITSILIPTLNRSITEQSSYDAKHKLNRKRFSVEREEQEILRVPIALALIKLMQKLPTQVLETSLPGVFIKVCTFLRSPLKSVRMLTRDILKKIMMTLGSNYLALLIDHLQTLLTRGFQVHVLAVTIHGVLDALREELKAEDIAGCLTNVLEVALNDIFGEVALEKDIRKIGVHAPEAKPSAKSFLVLHIVARKVPESCLLELLLPFKQHLARTQSRKVTLKIQQCFGNIVSGLVENVNMALESLLIFIYGTMSESITDLLPGIKKHDLTEQQKERLRRARPDCLLLQPTPRMRTCVINRQVQTNNQANAHILIEFGLEMLHIVLKRKKLLAIEEYSIYLNPLMPLLKDALSSTHIRVTTFALKCYASLWHDQYEVNRQQEQIGQVVERLFEILKNLSTFAANNQDENQQLLRAAYKALVALLHNRRDCKLTTEQMEQLLFQIEAQLFEGQQQALSFSLLKALIARRIQHKSLEEIMTKLSHLIVTAEAQFIRDEAQQILLLYVLEYTLAKHVSALVKFFSVQLSYELPSGRLSAIQFLEALIRKFPASMLATHAEFLYITLGTRLVNDDEPQCRKAIAAAIELLITRLEKVDRQRLFDMTLIFFNAKSVDNQVSVREMAAALCSRFLVAERQSFSPRLKILLPILVGRLSFNSPEDGGRFVRAPILLNSVDAQEVNEISQKRLKLRKKSLKRNRSLAVTDLGKLEEETLQMVQKEVDHEIIQVQYCLLKMFEYCYTELLQNKEELDKLAYESQRLLAHDHLWVRCNAAKILTHILSSYKFDLVAQQLMGKPQQNDDNLMQFIYADPAQDIKSLILDLCAQVEPGETPQTLIDEIVKIFLFVGNMLRDVPMDTKEDSKINLIWFVKQIRFLVNKEVAKAPHSTSVRTAFFTLIEGLLSLLGISSLEKLAPPLLLLLTREMSEEDQQIDVDLRQLALRVGSRMRKRLGADVYDKLRTSCQMKLMMKRAERKKLVAQEKIYDPVRAAKRKSAMQERKKSAKKLKANVMRGKVEDVKKKLKKRKRQAEHDLFD